MPNAVDQTAEHLGCGDVLRTALRLIFFRATQSELVSVGWKHLVFGLVSTWLVGMGRYWDNPRVGLAQRMGLGSVVYVFVLALFLWLIVWPLRPRHWSYFRVLTFITLVSPPAIIYAIPVEYFYSVDTANKASRIARFLLQASGRTRLVLNRNCHLAAADGNRGDADRTKPRARSIRFDGWHQGTHGCRRFLRRLVWALFVFSSDLYPTVDLLSCGGHR